MAYRIFIFLKKEKHILLMSKKNEFFFEQFKKNQMIEVIFEECSVKWNNCLTFLKF